MTAGAQVTVYQYVLPHYRKPFFTKLRDELRPLASLTVKLVSKEKLWEILRAATSDRSDLVVLNYEASNVLSWTFCLRARAGLPVPTIVLWGCGYEPPQSSVKAKAREVAQRWMGNSAHACIVYSVAAKEYYERTGVRTPITVAANSIDDQTLRQALQAADPHALPPDLHAHELEKSFNVLFIGRLIAAKKLPCAIDGLERFAQDQGLSHEDLHFIVIGDGPVRPELESMASRCRFKVTCVGAITDKMRIASIAKHCHAFLLTGAGGLAINEAMCLEVPVITSEADGTASQLIQSGQNGYVLTRDDPEEIAASLAALYRDPQLRSQFVQRALSVIENKVNLANMVKTFKEQLELLLRKA